MDGQNELKKTEYENKREAEKRESEEVHFVVDDNIIMMHNPHYKEKKIETRKIESVSHSRFTFINLLSCSLSYTHIFVSIIFYLLFSFPYIHSLDASDIGNGIIVKMMHNTHTQT